MGVMRIGHVKLRVMDMDAALDHYHNVLGLKQVLQDDNGDVYMKCWDEWDKYCLILTQSDQAGMDHVAYKVRRDSDLDAIQKRIEDWGIKTQWLAEGSLPDVGRMLQFNLPSGHEMRLYAHKTQVGTDVGDTNPDPWPDDRVGAGSHWLDHCLLMCELDPEKGVNTVADSARFLTECMDFFPTEQVVAKDGKTQLGVWMARSTTPHDIALVGAPTSGFHHIAFFLDSWEDVLRSADVMAKHRVRFDVAPTRHGITRGATIYFFDPSGNRNETFAGLGYMAQPDRPVTTWTEDQIGAGIFYHTGVLVPSFTEVYT